MGNKSSRRGKAKYLGGVGTKVTGISRRKFRPNLQQVHVTTANGTHKTVHSLTQCIRNGAVVKRISSRPVKNPENRRSKVVASHSHADFPRKDCEKVSLLARLLLSDEELDRMTSQLGDILGYIDLLSELDTEQVKPMAHALDVANVLRDDVMRPSLDREAALANAPRRDQECSWSRPCWGE